MAERGFPGHAAGTSPRRMSVDADAYGCKFPSCTKAAGVTVIDSAEEGIALCEEFRRLWEALEDRKSVV